MILNLASLGQFSRAIYLCQISSIFTQADSIDDDDASKDVIHNLMELIKSMNMNVGATSEKEEQSLGAMTEILVSLASSLASVCPGSSLAQCIDLSR